MIRNFVVYQIDLSIVVERGERERELIYEQSDNPKETDTLTPQSTRQILSRVPGNITRFLPYNNG